MTGPTAARRRVLGALLLAPFAGGRAHAQGPPGIAQPSAPSRTAFLAHARELRDAAVAAGDQPYGAVLVRQGLIVGEGRSQVVGLIDPTAHSSRWRCATPLATLDAFAAAIRAVKEEGLA